MNTDGTRDWRQHNRELERLNSREDFYTRPYVGQVRSFSDSEDRIRVAAPTGEVSISLSHPFLSSNSWIRAIPETNASVWLHARQDNRRVGMLGYINDTIANRLTDFKTGSGVYRSLKQGEIEINSYGVSGLYARRDGTLELRGGLVYGELSHPRLESWMRAPLHTRRLHLNQDSAIGDEERYGAVRRFKDEKAYEPVAIKNDDNTVRKEYYRDLKFKRKGSDQLKFRVRLQEGDVIDDDNKVRSQDQTKLPLRYLKELYTKSGDTFLSTQVDENGNFYFVLPKEADVGGSISIPAGALIAQIRKDIEIQTQQSLKVLAKAKIEETSGAETHHVASGDYTIETLQNLTMSIGIVLSATAKVLAEIKAPFVNLGNGARAGVITQGHHPTCYVTGWPIPCSATVKASL